MLFSKFNSYRQWVRYKNLPSKEFVEEQQPFTDTSSESTETGDHYLSSAAVQSRQSNNCRGGIWQILCLALAMSLGALLGWKLQPSWNSKCLDTAWNTLKDNVRYEYQEFNPRFTGPKSEYMGPPRPDLDDRWYKLSTMHSYAVDRKAVVAMNRTQGTVEYPGTNTYMVGLETFHQLHCLNYVRMYTNQEYYGKFDYDMIAENAEERRDHKDHCVEVLRQKLMCDPDLNVYTYHWVGHSEMPLANLHTPHKHCIAWDSFYEWQLTQTTNSRALRKPVGTDILY